MHRVHVSSAHMLLRSMNVGSNPSVGAKAKAMGVDRVHGGEVAAGLFLSVYVLFVVCFCF